MNWNKEDDPNGGFKNLYLTKEDYESLAGAVKAEMVVDAATGEVRGRKENQPTHPTTHRVQHLIQTASSPSTHPPTHEVQHLILTASSSSIFSTTHPPTHPSPQQERFIIKDVIGLPSEKDLGVENLKGSGTIAGETSVAYHDIFTLTVRPPTHPPTHPPPYCIHYFRSSFTHMHTHTPPPKKTKQNSSSSVVRWALVLTWCVWDNAPSKRSTTLLSS